MRIEHDVTINWYARCQSFVSIESIVAQLFATGFQKINNFVPLHSSNIYSWNKPLQSANQHDIELSISLYHEFPNLLKYFNSCKCITTAMRQSAGFYLIHAWQSGLFSKITFKIAMCNRCNICLITLPGVSALFDTQLNTVGVIHFVF